MKAKALLAKLRGDERFPSLLALVNLADTKRRNAHLGAVAVDRDITDFERALWGAARATDCFAQVGGDAWVVLGAPRLDAIRAAYARVDAYEAGWRLVAERGGEIREARGAARTTIARDLRALTARVDAASEIPDVVARLDLALFKVPVGELGWDLARAERNAPEGPRWSCVAEYPASHECPMCAGAAFAWDDGDGAVYSGDGRCLGCGAAVRLEDAGALAP